MGVHEKCERKKLGRMDARVLRRTNLPSPLGSSGIVGGEREGSVHGVPWGEVQDSQESAQEEFAVAIQRYQNMFCQGPRPGRAGRAAKKMDRP